MSSPTIFPRAGGGEADFDFYVYNPSKPAGLIFVVLFAIGTVVQIGYLIPYRSWSFIPFILGCAAEAGGYYGRAWAHDNIRLGAPYLLQLFLIIGAAPMLSASIYMTLPRITRALDAAEHSLIRLSWLSKIYILIDIACLVLQVIGTVAQAYGGSDKQQLAINLVAGGLIFQLVAFVVFMLLALRVHRRLINNPTHISAHLDVYWRMAFWSLYITSSLILLRNLVRIIEYVQGGDGYIITHEIFLYLFDAVPMFLVVLTLTVFYPGRLIKAARRANKLGRYGDAAPLQGGDTRGQWV
ncbi:uncharacterized protein LTR77_008059 [Saxophila tyrrhenica]|uniref:RTA1-like protein n=1 Tax=Saxophila tyrrhenica TaxID=1690608 RepID=A0AAV9P259_9PEZI|nr:hypothetical protein LTR77_008059 [Saxophila tyrrhenica]